MAFIVHPSTEQVAPMVQANIIVGAGKMEVAAAAQRWWRQQRGGNGSGSDSPEAESGSSGGCGAAAALKLFRYYVTPKRVH